MELAVILRKLWQYRILSAIAVVVAIVAGVLSSYHVGTDGISKRTSQSRFGAAQGSFYVDTRRPSLITSEALAPDLISRAKLVANFVGTGRVRSAVGQAMGVPAAQIQVEGPLPDQPGSTAQPVAQQRANQLIGEGTPYKIFVDTQSSASVVQLFVQAPDGPRAIKLAAAVPEALQGYLDQLTRDALPAERKRFDRSQVPTNDATTLAKRRATRQRTIDLTLAGRTVVRPLGDPVGGTVASETAQTVGGLVFLVVLVGGLILVLAFAALRSRRRAA
jgi:hypothetical protein